MKRIIYSVFAFTTCLTSVADDKVSLYADAVSDIGENSRLTIPVKMQNAVEIEAFVFHVSLPNGMVLETNIDKTDRWPMGNNIQPTHSVNVRDVANKDNTTQIAVYGRELFTGQDGNIVELNINIPEKLADGTYNIIIDAISFSEKGSVSHTQDVLNIPITVSTIINGDANKDGIVDKKDILAILEYMAGNRHSDFDVVRADANGDGVIDIADCTKILEILE